MKSQVKARFDELPSGVRSSCLAMRDIAFAAASSQPEIGPLTETLKWGEPSYLTQASKTGSTLRIWRTRDEETPALFVNCQTRLIERFRDIYPTAFDYRDNRAVVLTTPVKDVAEPLKHCMVLTFTYHLWK